MYGGVVLAICQNWSLQCFTAAFLNFLKDEKNMLAQLISFKHEETHTTTYRIILLSRQQSKYMQI